MLAQMVKNLPATQETPGDTGSIPGSGRSQEKRMATHSRILAEESHGQRSLGGYSLWGIQELDMTE